MNCSVCIYIYIYIYICICIFMSKWTTYLLTVITSLFLFVGQLTLSSSSSSSSAQNLTTGEANCCTECRRRLHAVIVVFCFLLFIAAVCKSSYFIYLLLPTKLGSSGCCRSCLCVCVCVCQQHCCKSNQPVSLKCCYDWTYSVRVTRIN